MATRYARVITAAAALAVLSGCAPPMPGVPTAPAGDVSTTPTTTAASTAPFTLFTHCGIYETRVRDTFFVADQPLDGGQGNPPAGWGNPFQSGTITVEGPRAVFHDDAGHTVTFHERPGATRASLEPAPENDKLLGCPGHRDIAVHRSFDGRELLPVAGDQHGVCLGCKVVGKVERGKPPSRL